MTLPLAAAIGSRPSKPKAPGHTGFTGPPPPPEGGGFTGPPAPPAPKAPQAITVEGGLPSYAASARTQSPPPNPAYKRAVLTVFSHQPAKVQGALALRALKSPDPAGQIILDQLRSETKGLFKVSSLPQPVQEAIPRAQVFTALIARGVAPPGVSSAESPVLKAAMHAVLMAQPVERRQQILSKAESLGVIPKSGDFFDAINYTFGRLGSSIAGGLASLRGATTPGGGHDIASIQGGPSGGQVAANAAKDLVSLPASTLTSVAQIAKDAVTGHEGQAAKDVYQPFVNIAEHPGQSFMQHPLDTALMVGGLVHGASRVAAAPLRALAPADSAIGRAVSTSREGVALTGKLTHERPPYSKSPTIKMSQKSVERGLLYKRAPDGRLIPQEGGVAGAVGLRDRLINQDVGQLVGVRERIRTANRAATILAREKAVRPSLVGRAAHGLRTALSYGPRGAAIPGADVLARIVDGTIRRPDTVAVDLQKHLEKVAATRPDLLGDPQALKAHDAYVKELKAALANKRFLKDPGPAFKAAEQYAKDYGPVEAKAHALGHFGADMSREGLLRRTLQHYAAAHMDARVDPELGLVVDRAVKGPVSAEATVEPVPLPTEAIRKHLTGPEGIGSRTLAYTPDRVGFDRSNRSFYVSSERRPLPTTKRNTLYAYTHGLTRPGHDALLEQHVLMQGIIDSHHAQNAYLDTLATQKPGGGYWDTYQAAKRDAPAGYRPINISQPFHPQAALESATQDANPASIEEEAVRRSLDLRERLAPGTSGRWAVIDERALKALRAHENQIQPNALLRTVRGLNNQFRSVALSTSAKHVPGVLQENLIRDIGHGVGLRSWITGRKVLRSAQEMRPEAGRELRVQLTGGQVAGMTEAGKTYTVSDHWAGTSAYPFLRGMEAMFKAPGARQLRGLWRGWTHIAIRGTKRLLEEQHQIAGLGKAVLREHGYVEAAKADGFVGLFQRALGLHGRMIDDAAKGLFDPAKARQMRAAIQQMYGKWTDLAPSAQTALMFSPFGLWWVNSARFLARMPVDQPVKTSLLAAANVGTQKERAKEGLDMFAPGALPLYEQGGIPLGGGRILAQNYYSPFGIANDPLATGQSLLQPWLTPIVAGSIGVNWLGKPLSSPSNKGGYKHSNVAERAQYILDSALASFVPLYTKAQQLASGGASQYDVSGNSVLPSIPTPTKTPGKGILAGAEKAFRPFREYTPHPKSGGSSSGISASGISATGIGASGISATPPGG